MEGKFRLLLLCLFAAEKLVSTTGVNQPSSDSSTEDQTPSYFFYKHSEYPRDCVEVLRKCSSRNSSGVFAIKPDGYSEVFDVSCDSHGYTVIGRRLNGIISFNRSWEDYVSGFGFPSHEFWLGNQRLSYLTNQKRYQLRIDVTLNNQTTLSVAYDGFRISDAFSDYKLISTGQFTVTGWGYWGPCSVTCGVGVSRRYRHCTDGAVCVGGSVEEAVCRKAECEVVGGWSDWSAWTDCSVSCGGSMQIRNRTCNNPAPLHGGQDCTGIAQQSQRCGTDPCPVFTDCQDVFNSGQRNSGRYHITPSTSGSSFEVYCDISNGGGWTVFQRRTGRNRDVDFYRDWASYREGFGSLDEDFWLGNEKIHHLTTQRNYKLRVDFVSSSNSAKYSEYATFRTAPESDKYRLTVSTSNTGNGDNGMYYTNGEAFSTHDRDNDECGTHNCAAKHRGAWWYTDYWCSYSYYSYCYYFNYGSGSYDNTLCTYSNLNGDYDGGNGQNIFWYYYNNYCNLNSVEMKIRPSD